MGDAVTSRKRFVSVPTHRLEELLEDVGERVRARGGSFLWTSQGRERVFELTPHASPVPTRIRIFTSVAVGESAARDCGKDAIRIVVGRVQGADPDRGANGVFRPLEKGTKILRTAPQGIPEAHRIEKFVERLKGAIRDAYVRARAVKACPTCGSPMARRKGSNGPFLGCSSYPKCKTTRPIVSPGNR